MSDFNSIVEKAVAAGSAPFLCGSLVDADGTRWEGYAGRANSLHEAGPDTAVRLFSATKAIGSLMAVLAIDRGLITMDTPIGDVLPSFDELQVLERMTPEGPKFRPARTRGTLRHVLTHTQGQGYEAFYELQRDYVAQTGAPQDLSGLEESLNYPLLFDPGTGFAYGIGTDWVGKIVATLDGRSVDRFVREEILVPLGMNSTVFEAAEAGEHLADLRFKGSGEDGGFGPFELRPASHPELYHMGHALYSTVPDYSRFLRMVLRHGELDGVRIASPEAMSLMFTDQIVGTQVPAPILSSTLIPQITFDVDIIPGTKTTHTAAFFMNVDSVPGRRSPGSLSWAGFLNTHYWIDPMRGIAGTFFTQMLPFFDPALMSAFEEFERAASG